MKKSFFIIFMILIMSFFSACKKEGEDLLKVSDEAFHGFILNNLIYSVDMGSILNAGQIITRPPGISQLITSFVVLKEESVKNKRLCLYYKVPFRDQQGELAFIESEDLEACPELFNEANRIIHLSGVSEFKSDFKNFHYEMIFKLNSEDRRIKFPLFNIEKGVVHEKYHAEKNKALYSGLKIIKINDEHFNYKKSHFLGNLADRFENNTAIRCLQVSEACSVIGENLCDRCRYGSYEVVDYSCPQGGSRFCGQNRCGQKNEPACPIGSESKSEDAFGICQEDLTPVLNADKIWICQ